MPAKKPTPKRGMFDPVPVASPPSYAGNVEYCGVPNDRLLFAVYDAEKQQRNHTDAVYALHDQVDGLKSEVEDLSSTVNDLKKANEKLTEAIEELSGTIRELRDATAQKE